MRTAAFRTLLGLLAVALAACGGGGQPQPDLSLVGLLPQNPTVAQGGTVDLTLTFASQNGFQGLVTLSVTENGQNPTWLTLSPTSKNLNVPKGGQVQENLQVSVAPNAPAGPHTLRLRATYGGRTAEVDLTLTVTPPPGFTLSLNPTSLTVEQGSSGQTTLTLTPQHGFTGTVDLSLVGAPSGVTLSPASVNVTGTVPVTQTLTVSVDQGVAPGTYQVRVRATSGSLVKEADLTLTVTSPASSVRLTMDWDPLIRASGLEGQDGPITLTGTLEGTPTVPLRLQLSYRPKDGDWGPWQDVAELQVGGNQVTATIPAPGLALPRGLDELGKAVRARVVMGDQVLQSLAGQLTIRRFYPIWKTTWSHLGEEFHASQTALCGYANTDWIGFKSRVLCWNPENGEPLAQADLTGLLIHDVFISPEGKVYLAGSASASTLRGFEPAVRVYPSPQALGTAAFAELRLTGTFDHVTAVAAEGDHLYVGGNRWISFDQGQCYGSFLRIRLAKYALSGSGASLVALHDPTPEDLQEIDLARYTSFLCDKYAVNNSTSVPLVRLDGGKLYAVFVHTRTTYAFDRYGTIDTACLGLMRLDTATFQREWLNRPLRSGANGESDWSGNCDRDGRDRDLRFYSFFYYYNSENPPCDFYGCHTVVYSYTEFDIGDTHLYAHHLYEPSTRKAKLLRKDDGREEVTATTLGKFIFTGSGNQIVTAFVAGGAALVQLGTTYEGMGSAYKVEGISLQPNDYIPLLFREGSKVYLSAPAENGGWVVRIR